ncbi:MAG: MFS transporter [Pseudomonadota bacterium]
MPPQSLNFALLLFAYYAHAGTFSTYASLFFAERGMTVGQIGVLMSLVQVMRIVGPNLWGWVADHTGARVMVLRLTALAALLSFSGIAAGHSFPAFVAAMALLNLFTSAQGPMCDALMVAEMRGDLTYYGRLRLWGSVGFIVAVTAAGYAMQWFGIVALPWIAGALLVCVLLASLRLREVTLPARHADTPSLASLMRKPEVLAFFGASALMVAAHAALYVFYSLYLATNGYSKSVIGLMWSLGVVAEVAVFYCQAPLFQRWGARRILYLSFALALLRFAMIGAGAHLLAVLVAAQLLHGATFAAHHSASVSTMQRWFAGPLQSRGQALYISIAYGLGGSLGGLFLAKCWERFGPGSVYWVACALAACALLAMRLSFRYQDRQPAVIASRPS